MAFSCIVPGDYQSDGGASLKGAIDPLADLKSNVIIGRLLPLGEEFEKKIPPTRRGRDRG